MDPSVRELFSAFVARLPRFGPVTVLPEKTRIAFHVRMSFAALSVRQTISPRNHVHRFRVGGLADLDEECSAWGGEAYAVGQQEHLTRGIRRHNGTAQ
jgi:hypothetical protein